MRNRGIVVAIALTLLLGPNVVRAQDSAPDPAPDRTLEEVAADPGRPGQGGSGGPSLAVWGGSFDVLNGDPSTEAGLELRLAPRWRGEWPVPWSLAPAVGVMGTSEDTLYAHAGLRLEVPLGDRWTLTPQLAAGYYDAGDDKDLGGELHFRSGIEASVRLTARQRLGVLFYHLSNAGIEDRNPGAESLVLQWSWAF